MKKIFILITLSLLSAQFCGEMYPPDTDDEQPKALRLTPEILVKDEIDVNKSDSTDWKDFSYFKEANVTVVFMFGEPFTPHRLNGTITLFNFKGEVLDKTQVYPRKREYPFSFLSTPSEHFFFKIDAKKGGSPYMVETKIQPVDPCLKCRAEEICCKPDNICCRPNESCVEGKCTDKSGECDPPCTPDKICENGVCEKPCKGGCPKGKICSRELKRCVPAEEKKCPAGTVKKGNKCISESKCNPPCGANEICNGETGTCEPSGNKTGTIVNYYPVSSGTEFIINLGSVDGIKIGSKGFISGVKGGSFTVIEVYPSRAKAKTKVTRDIIGKATQVIINM
jgi:hypothetical protein